jgi:hypothetical protein
MRGITDGISPTSTPIDTELLALDCRNCCGSANYSLKN